MTTPFLIFAWKRYYPEGGSFDFVRAFDTLAEAETAARQLQAEREGAPYSSDRYLDWIEVVEVVDGGLTRRLRWSRFENGLLGEEPAGWWSCEETP